ncbi:hypothetical protein D9613_006306 [Agrocybe pediades]|uniref:Uncharacterized protein n=1 Tax=Agrocybe pediades TaxID=84607 RepID=A0A8H4QVT8_9AGAR|nr:hypothetical protein D9613_006306 [Agrocybe pediades]
MSQTLGNMAYEYDRSCKVFNLPSALECNRVSGHSVLFDDLEIRTEFESGLAQNSAIHLDCQRRHMGIFAAISRARHYLLFYAKRIQTFALPGYRMLLNVRKFAETGSEDRIANINSIPLTSLVTRSTIRPDDPVEENNIENAALPNVIV